MSECTQVPSFIPGRVVGKIEVDICMDGARFLFLPTGWSVHLRVKATNGGAEKALEEAFQNRQEVVIAGYFCRGAECHRFDCYHASDAEAFTAAAESLTG